MCQLKKSRRGQINPFGTWPFGTPLPPTSSTFVHASSRLEAPHHEQCTRQTAHGNFFYILPRAIDPNQSGMFPPTPVRDSLLLQGLKVFKFVIPVKKRHIWHQTTDCTGCCCCCNAPITNKLKNACGDWLQTKIVKYRYLHWLENFGYYLVLGYFGRYPALMWNNHHWAQHQTFKRTL